MERGGTKAEGGCGAGSTLLQVMFTLQPHDSRTHLVSKTVSRGYLSLCQGTGGWKVLFCFGQSYYQNQNSVNKEENQSEY